MHRTEEHSKYLFSLFVCLSGVDGCFQLEAIQVLPIICDVLVVQLHTKVFHTIHIFYISVYCRMLSQVFSLRLVALLSALLVASPDVFFT